MNKTLLFIFPISLLLILAPVIFTAQNNSKVDIIRSDNYGSIRFMEMKSEGQFIDVPFFQEVSGGFLLELTDSVTTR